ncbi:hypothetical protein GCM10009828_098120 [Actinoplanes couchii]
MSFPAMTPVVGAATAGDMTAVAATNPATSAPVMILRIDTAVFLSVRVMRRTLKVDHVTRFRCHEALARTR